MDETAYLHTLDIEAYEAAVNAAEMSLRSNHLNTPARLLELANEDGVVGDAARIILDQKEMS